ncbi:hypothetical protein MKX08_003905 [Trichoderma sp. CBMAI-0020]|nr:hypothetical protein MKX08_003905 [Trichoderma sp. CBMAI-0020]
MPTRHWGRLELQANFGTIDNEILFHTVFSKRGSSEYDEKIEKQRKARAVGFGNNMCYDGVEDEARRHETTEVASTSEFCKLLGRDIGSGAMDVRIKDETLFILQRAVEIEVDIANGRSISLADVLSNHSLVPKTKLVLAYILAKSVWQFYDSDFMGVSWTTRSIQLFREREDDDDDDEPGVDWAPYYAFSLEQMTERDSVERLPRGQFLHRYPRVLALGAMLYELGQKKSWKNQAASLEPASSTSHIEPPTLERIINDTASKIRKGVQKGEWPHISLKNTQTLEEYRVIVANCASENFFRSDLKEKLPNSPEQALQKTAEELEAELTIAERRAILFKKVVAPLKEMVRTAGWVDKSGNVRRFSMKGATTRLKYEGPDLGRPRSETLLYTSQTSQRVRTPQYGIQDGRRASRAEAESRLNKAKGRPDVSPTAQGLHNDEAKSAQRRDNLVDQRPLQDQRDVTGNHFNNRTVIHQGDNHYYLPD